jgi:hypothetical protein
MAIKLFADNRQVLTLPAVVNVDGDPVTGASITATLLKDDLTVADANFNQLAMSDVIGVPGNYSCEIAEAFSPPPGQQYHVLYESPGFRTKQRAYVVTRTTD